MELYIKRVFLRKKGFFLLLLLADGSSHSKPPARSHDFYLEYPKVHIKLHQKNRQRHSQKRSPIRQFCGQFRMKARNKEMFTSDSSYRSCIYI